MPFFRRKSNRAKANDRVSKRINSRATTGSSPTRQQFQQEEPKVLVPVLLVEEPPVATPISESEESDESLEAEKTVPAFDTPLTADEDGRSPLAFAQDFVEEFTDMVSEDGTKLAEKVETGFFCCGY